MATNGHTGSAPDGYVIKILNGEIVRAPYVPARKKPGQEEEEEAGATIRLGPDFQYAHALSVSEARLIVEKTEEVRKKTGKKLRETENLLKMQTYMDTFARFRSLGTLNQIETLLANYESVGMDSFEKAQLVSLACVESDEAKTLIPSLSEKMADDDLTNLCEQISQQRQFMDDA